MLRDHSEPTTSARQTLVESEGSPFSPSEDVRPVVEVIDGQRTNADVEPEDWIRALEAGGDVAIYFEIAGDLEWWLGYDDSREYGCELEGPYQHATRAPSEGWNYMAKTRAIICQNLEMLYGDDRCDIRRSQVVRRKDADPIPHNP